MAAVTPDIATGAAITFETGFCALVTDINWTGISREALPTSTLTTTGGMTFLPGKLYDPGELSVTLQFDTDATPPLTEDPEALTITWPDAETWACDGFMTGFSITAVLETVMTAEATIKFTDDITF